MTAEARILRRLRQAPDLLAEMEKLEAEIKAKVRRETDRIARVNAPGKSRKTRREERNERAAKIREAVMLRAGANCEWCGAANMRLELHHVVSGPSRQFAEAVETCAAICPDCHRLLHRNEGAAFTLARIWAERGSYSVALREIQRRQAKAASRAAGGTR